MKFVFALLALYLLGTTFAAHSKVASAAAAEAATREAITSLRRLSSTKLGKTLIDTIQIELKSSQGADPRPRLLDLLHEIQDETNEQLRDYNDHIAAVRQDCSETERRLAQEIADNEADLAEAERQQSAAAENQASVHSQLEAAVALQEALQSQLSTATSLRAQAAQEYERSNAKLQRIRTPLETVRNFITERLDQLASSSFLQKNNILVEVRKKVMAPEFQKASPGWGKLISFIANKALDKIRLQDGSSADSLQRIVNVINDVLDRINQSINDQNAAEAAAVEAFATISGQLEDALRTTAANLASLELQAQTNTNNLESLASRIEADNQALSQAASDLADKNSSCAHAENQYTDDLSRSNEEADIIQQVIDIVSNQLSNLVAAVGSANPSY